MNAASILWPENELDTAIQHLFDKYLNKTPTNDNGILLSDECRDFIPHFFVIWENCECKMTARNDFHIPCRALSDVHSESGIHRPRIGPKFCNIVSPGPVRVPDLENFLGHDPRCLIFAGSGSVLGPRPYGSGPILVVRSLLRMV